MTVLSLSKQSSDDLPLTNDLISKWNKALLTLDKNTYVELAITLPVSIQFKSDFTGLLNELKIPLKYHYPMLRINKYDSPMCYNGESNIYSLSNEVLENLYESAVSEEKINEV